jgi:hypothetical protein
LKSNSSSISSVEGFYYYSFLPPPLGALGAEIYSSGIYFSPPLFIIGGCSSIFLFPIWRES